MNKRTGQGQWPARPAGSTTLPQGPAAQQQPPGVQRETGSPAGGQRHSKAKQYPAGYKGQGADRKA